jgi:ABC-2 type transport system permease protein
MRALDLAIKDLLQIVRDVKSFFFILFMPIIFTFFFGWIFSGIGGEEDIRLPVGIINQDLGDDLSAELEGYINQSDAIRPIQIDEDELKNGLESAREAVLDEEYAAVAIIPENYGRALLAGELPRLTVLVDPYSQAGDTANRAIDAAVTRLVSAPAIALISTDILLDQGAIQDDQSSQLIDQVIMDVSVAWENPPINIQTTNAGNESEEVEGVFNAFGQASPGMIVQFSVFGLITASNILVLERKFGVLARMLTTPITRVQIIGGHVLAMFILVIVQVGILILVGQFIFDLDYFNQTLATLLMVLSLAFFASSLGLLIGSISKSEDQVIMFSMLAMFILSAMGGAWFPLDITGETFSRIGHLLPTAWAMDGFQNIILRSQGLESVFLPIGILLGYGVVCFAIAIWRFDYE